MMTAYDAAVHIFVGHNFFPAYAKMSVSANKLLRTLSIASEGFLQSISTPVLSCPAGRSCCCLSCSDSSSSMAAKRSRYCSASSSKPCSTCQSTASSCDLLSMSSCHSVLLSRSAMTVHLRSAVKVVERRLFTGHHNETGIICQYREFTGLAADENTPKDVTREIKNQ